MLVYILVLTQNLPGLLSVCPWILPVPDAFSDHPRPRGVLTSLIQNGLETRRSSSFKQSGFLWEAIALALTFFAGGVCFLLVGASHSTRLPAAIA